MPQIYREVRLEKDADGMPLRMFWCGDRVLPSEPTQAEKDAAKLAEWEKIYGGGE